MGGRPDGNRQDNRQRGNAAQLLEKYKSMARDAQLGGDRVQSEYYLKFADHYFRVLSESRSRFDEQRPRRGDDGEDDGDEEMAEAGDDSQSESRDEDQRFERNERNERRDRAPRRDRPQRYARDERNGEEAQATNGSGSQGHAESIAVDVLPPAIGRDEPAEAADSEEEAPRPRRRARRTRDEGDDVAPAA